MAVAWCWTWALALARALLCTIAGDSGAGMAAAAQGGALARDGGVAGQGPVAGAGRRRGERAAAQDEQGRALARGVAAAWCVVVDVRLCLWYFALLGGGGADEGSSAGRAREGAGAGAGAGAGFGRRRGAWFRMCACAFATSRCLVAWGVVVVSGPECLRCWKVGIINNTAGLRSTVPSPAYLLLLLPFAPAVHCPCPCLELLLLPPA